VYPLGDFYQIFITCGQLHYRPYINIWADWLKGFQSYRSLNVGVFCLTFSAPLAVKLCVGCEYLLLRCKNCSIRISSIIVPSLVELGLRTPPGGEKVKCFCLFLSVTLLNDKVCEYHFAINALEYGNSLGIAGKGNVCCCAPAFNFVSATLGGATAERRI